MRTSTPKPVADRLQGCARTDSSASGNDGLCQSETNPRIGATTNRNRQHLPPCRLTGLLVLMMVMSVGVGCQATSAYQASDWFSLDREGRKARLRQTFARADENSWQNPENAATNSNENAAKTGQHPAIVQFAEAQQHFRQENYNKAASICYWLIRYYEDIPEIEEEALYLRAESLYNLRKLPSAEDQYARLLTKYPTSRHRPQAVERLYEIASYWLEDTRTQLANQTGSDEAGTIAPVGATTSQSSESKIWLASWWDPSKPWLDASGEAIKALETIQQHDPLGPLADDSIMLAGHHEFLQGEYLSAASYYEQLLVEHPHSEHLNAAIILGAKSYLRAYQGPEYDASDLEKAAKLTKLALQRRSTLDPAQVTKLEADMEIITGELARRDFTRGEHYRRMRKPESARFYYHLTLKEYPNTEWAIKASQRLAELDQQVAAGYSRSLPQWLTPWKKAPVPVQASTNSEPAGDNTGAPPNSSEISNPGLSRSTTAPMTGPAAVPVPGPPNQWR